MPKFARDRYEICKRCQYKEKVFNGIVCSLCGCYIPAKVMVEDEVCYDERW